jgi:hypothetical protein
MRILGLDAGTRDTGYCFIDYPCEVIDSGHIENNEVFKLIPQCDHLALEVIRNQGKKIGNEVFETAQWIGRFQQYAIDHGINNIFEVTKKQHSEYHINLCWKVHGKLFKGCNDSQLRQALDMLGHNSNICDDNDARNAFSVANYIIKRFFNFN